VLACGGALALLVIAVLDSFLWAEPDYPRESAQVGSLLTQSPGQRAENVIPTGTFLFLRERTTAFAALAAARRETMTLGLTGAVERIGVERVTPDFFAVHQFRLAAGRTFTAEEEVSDAAVTVLSHPFASRLFGEPSAALGQIIRLDGRSFTVIGVLPPLPPTWATVSAWVPFAFTARDRGDFTFPELRISLRLQPGISFAAATDELNRFGPALKEHAPDQVRDWRVEVRLWREELAAPLRPFQGLLGAAAGVSAVLAALNAASLLLSRAAQRQRDIAVRIALGAPRRALLVPCVLQSAAIAGVGAGGAWLGCVVLLQGLRSAEPTALFLRLAESESPRLLVFAAVLGMLYFALLAATLAHFVRRISWHDSLKQTRIADRRVRRTQQGIVIAQVALGVALIANSGTLVDAWRQLRATPLGFAPEARAHFVMQPAPGRYATPEAKIAFARACEARLAELPGVERVAVSTALPLVGQRAFAFQLPGADTSPQAASNPRAIHAAVSPHYFDTMGIAVVAGRGFEASSPNSGTKVAVINRTLARQYFGDRDPLNTWIYPGTGESTWRLIIGVVDDVCHGGLRDARTPQIYEPFWQDPSDWFYVVLRGAAGRALPSPAAIQAAITLVDPEQAIGSVKSYSATLDQLTSRERLTAGTFLLAACIATLLAGSSLAALLALQTLERTPEFALRLALGSAPAALARLIVIGALRLVSLGIGLGVLAGYLLGKLSTASVVGISSPGPLAYAGAALAAAAIAVAAAWLPARRATRLDPARLLQSD